MVHARAARLKDVVREYLLKGTRLVCTAQCQRKHGFELGATEAAPDKLRPDVDFLLIYTDS